jgi:SAM-dependent methyltransferase
MLVLKENLLQRIGAALPLRARRWLRATRDMPLSPARGQLDLGDLRRLTPISREYGYDRGTPIDRYYIENFLEAHSNSILGRVLEISENTYTRRFGGPRVTHSDVLHYDNPAPPSTIIGDLTYAPHIPSESFDCVIITQTLMLIFDVRAAVETLHRVLKPGGTLLASMAGITQIADPNWLKTWHWSFTQHSAQRLFEQGFPGAAVEARSYGNVLTSIAYLHGLAHEELSARELDYNDPEYQMLITVIAQKAVA